MNSIALAERKLHEECHALAKALRWQRKPFDAEEIGNLGESFYRSAIVCLPFGDGDRLWAVNCMRGAVEVLHANICGPNNHDPEEWFNHSILTLMSIVEPTSTIETEAGLGFLRELEKGIRYMRTGANA